MTETKSSAAVTAGEQTPIIFLDDIHVVFKTRTGSILIRTRCMRSTALR